MIGQELAEEFKDPTWRKELRKEGFNWVEKFDPGEWTDYSDLDVLVAARSFSAGAGMFDNKPATKLYNAWHAGVPALLGKESAYRFEKRSDLDYMEVTSPEEVTSSLKRLRVDMGLRGDMTANGRERAREMNNETIAGKWEDFLTDVAVPCYHAWRASKGMERQMYFTGCSISMGKDALFKEVNRNIRRFLRPFKRMAKK